MRNPNKRLPNNYQQPEEGVKNMPIQIVSLGLGEDSQYPDFPLVNLNLQITVLFAQIFAWQLTFCTSVMTVGLAVIKI